MPTIAKDERLVQNENSVFREEDDGAFLFDPEGGRLKYLNTTGAEVYRLCDGTRNVEEIVDVVAGVFAETPRKDIERDVTAFLATLLEMNFIVRACHDI